MGFCRPNNGVRCYFLAKCRRKASTSRPDPSIAQICSFSSRLSFYYPNDVFWRLNDVDRTSGWKDTNSCRQVGADLNRFRSNGCFSLNFWSLELQPRSNSRSLSPLSSCIQNVGVNVGLVLLEQWNSDFCTNLYELITYGCASRLLLVRWLPNLQWVFPLTKRSISATQVLRTMPPWKVQNSRDESKLHFGQLDCCISADLWLVRYEFLWAGRCQFG